jgi:hypothetical protein
MDGCGKSGSHRDSSRTANPVESRYYDHAVPAPSFGIIFPSMSLSRGAKIPGGRSLWRQNFCKVWPNISGSSNVWNLIRVTLLTPRILRWLLYFWKNCGPLVVFSKWFLPLRFQLYDIHQSASSSNVLVDYRAVIRVSIILDYHKNFSSIMNYSWIKVRRGRVKYAHSGESVHTQTHSNHIILG